MPTEETSWDEITVIYGCIVTWSPLTCRPVQQPEVSVKVMSAIAPIALFGLGLVLGTEDDVEIRIDGEPSILGAPGGVGHIPFKKRHTAIAGKDGAKVLVFRVHTKGQPWRYIDE